MPESEVLRVTPTQIEPVRIVPSKYRPWVIRLPAHMETNRPITVQTWAREQDLTRRRRRSSCRRGLFWCG